MGRFDSGVMYYTVGHAQTEVHFPEDDVKCQWCPFLRADANGIRHKCGLTGNIIYGPGVLDARCPLIFSTRDAKAKEAQ